MSADEIRRLAEDCHRKAYAYGQTIERLVELNKESALLAYAAMVERCEKLKLNMIPHRHDKEIVNYILKGETDERK